AARGKGAHDGRGLAARPRRPARPAVRVKGGAALPRLHAVTDERIARRPDLDAMARDLAEAGGTHPALHARGHALSGSEHCDLANQLAAYPPSRVFVNDRLDIALATGAAGVQLAHGSLDPSDARRLNPQWWIGKSVHDLAAA